MKTSKLFKLLLIIFLASGFAGLVYEIVWIRMLVFIFGNTAQSITTVVSIFMAGLAVGSIIFGKIADRSTNLIKLYAYLELGIGLLGILSPLAIKVAKNIFLYYSAFVIDNNILFLILKIILSFFIIFPPTLLMGGTLPVLIRFYNNIYGHLSKQTGRLYGFNTLGAVLGVLLTGFVFIELFGLYGSLAIAVITSHALGLTALYLTKRPVLSQIKAGKIESKTEKVRSTFYYSKHQIIFLLLTYFISGFISLSYEILWTRLITPAAGIYIYGFSLMLASFLLGLALGSLIYERYFSTVKQTFMLVGMLQMLLAISAFGVIVFVSFAMPIWTRYLYRLSVPLIVFLPPTTIMGMMFPAIIKVFEKEKRVGEKIGLVYALNSFGSIIGSAIAGFLLIPLFSTVESVLTLAIINSIIGLFLIIQEPTFRFKFIVPILTTPIMLLLIFALYNSKGLFLPRLYKVHIKDSFKRDPSAQFVIKEDSVASLLVTTNKSNQRRGKALYIDGVSTTGLVEEVKMIAHLPIIIHPQPKDVLIIGFGMGTTFRSALSYPNLNVDAVELIPSVPQLMPYFHADGEIVLNNPRGNIIINDGRNYVFITKKKYDIVTIDPPPPTNGAGTTVLFSEEFYQDIKKKLKAGGIIHQWILFDLDTTSVKMMIKSFVKNFNHILAFLAPSGKGMYLVGSDKPLKLNKNRLNSLLTIKSVAKDMAEWSTKTYSYEKLLKMYIGNEKQLNNFVKEAPAVTDYHPRTEYSLIHMFLYPQPVLTKEDLIASFNTQL